MAVEEWSKWGKRGGKVQKKGKAEEGGVPQQWSHELCTPGAPNAKAGPATTCLHGGNLGEVIPNSSISTLGFALQAGPTDSCHCAVLGDMRRPCYINGPHFYSITTLCVFLCFIIAVQFCCNPRVGIKAPGKAGSECIE